MVNFPIQLVAQLHKNHKKLLRDIINLLSDEKNVYLLNQPNILFAIFIIIHTQNSFNFTCLVDLIIKLNRRRWMTEGNFERFIICNILDIEELNVRLETGKLLFSS